MNTSKENFDLHVSWFVGGWTHTGTALEMAYTQLFASNKGARANVAKVTRSSKSL